MAAVAAILYAIIITNTGLMVLYLSLLHVYQQFRRVCRRHPLPPCDGPHPLEEQPPVQVSIRLVRLPAAFMYTALRI
jgi:hypothetical protein